MADFVSSLDNPPMISSASSSRATVADHEDDFKDAYSICHKEAKSALYAGSFFQELLAAVENERNLRSRRNACHEDYEMNIDKSYGDDSDFDLPLPDVQHMRTTSPEEYQTSSYEFSEGDSPTFSTLRSVVPEAVNVEPNSVGNRDGCNKPSPESPQRPSSSEFLAFSESVKSKFSVASARYKESISKSTRGFKEKLLAHNISVKELGRGVQREMNAVAEAQTSRIKEKTLDLEGDVVEMRTSAQLWVPHFIPPMKAFTLCRTIRNQSRRLCK
ncbi:hypothetical protein TEA_021306 [Camellia sinensis var. sinensis]|uniref:Uncharacterized protein n=1 Tax=Camellia sinensis var. sinensis TaxID=542762 RepID=A0A4S4DZ20_CAMSN|nr:hypothetical protein TEA_021306 [Camellia sinensis var. sinensis]